MTVYTDPFGWMRSIYGRLRENPSFARLAQQHQFDELVRAVADEQPAQAELLRRYSHAAKLGLLEHLASMNEQGHTADSIELWRATKDDRVLTCVARHLPTGVDLVVFHNGELRNSQLCPTGPDARTLAALWKAALEKSGWASSS